MLNKFTVFAFAVASTLAGSLVAFAQSEGPENKIGDRYPFLEPTIAARNLKARPVVSAGRSRSSQMASVVEDPEDKIGDRYPFLEPTIAASNLEARPVVSAGRSRSSQWANEVEVPESKIADRYPFLEMPYPNQPTATVVVTAMKNGKRYASRVINR